MKAGTPRTRNALGMLLSGDAIDVRTFKNEPIFDRTYLVLFNAHHEEISFTLPGREKVRWETVIDTMDENGFVTPGKTECVRRRVRARRSLSKRVATRHRSFR